MQEVALWPACLGWLFISLAAGIPAGKILHTAQSLFHDHVQAKAHGLTSAWIDRRIDTDGWGATMPPEAPVTPDFHFPTLEAMAEAREEE